MTSQGFTTARRLFGIIFLVRGLWYGFLAYFSYFNTLYDSYATAMFETFSNLIFAVYFLFAAFALLRRQPLAPALHFSVAFSVIFFERIAGLDPILIPIWIVGVITLSILIYRCIRFNFQPDEPHV